MHQEPNPDSAACSIPCNLCGRKNVHQLSLKDRQRSYLRTVICCDCGLIWSDPRSNDDELKDFYATKYRKQYKSIYEPKPKHIHRDAVEAAKRYHFLKGVIKSEDTILDVGSGSGVFVYTLGRLGFDATGLEPDQSHSTYARKALDVPITTGFIQDIQTDVQTPGYNLITLHHVLEHFSDPFENLKIIWELLKPNGHLMLEAPNALDARQDPKNRYHMAHLYTFTPKTIETILQKAGFETVKKSVAPLNGNITLVARKLTDFSPITGEIPGSFEEIKKTLEHHTNLRHFTSSVPYRKAIVHFIKAIREQIAVFGQKNPTHLINKVIAAHIGK